MIDLTVNLATFVFINLFWTHLYTKYDYIIIIKCYIFVNIVRVKLILIYSPLNNIYLFIAVRVLKHKSKVSNCLMVFFPHKMLIKEWER